MEGEPRGRCREGSAAALLLLLLQFAQPLSLLSLRVQSGVAEPISKLLDPKFSPGVTAEEEYPPAVTWELLGLHE